MYQKRACTISVPIKSASFRWCKSAHIPLACPSKARLLDAANVRMYHWRAYQTRVFQMYQKRACTISVGTKSPCFRCTKAYTVNVRTKSACFRCIKSAHVSFACPSNARAFRCIKSAHIPLACLSNARVSDVSKAHMYHLRAHQKRVF